VPGSTYTGPWHLPGLLPRGIGQDGRNRETKGT
jgi:hypothetical protein